MLASLLRHALIGLLLMDVAQAALAPASLVDKALQEPRFESVGADAIPRNVVAALAQDKFGLIWIATGDGLVRFDGYRFRAQERASTDATRRSLGWIRALLPGRDGRLWIGTETDGLAVYDPKTEIVQDLELGGDATHTGVRVPYPTIRALAEGGEGNIWVGSLR